MDKNISINNEHENYNNEFFRVQENLLQHVRNKDNYRTQQYKAYNKAHISKDYSSQNQRRLYFNECIFNQASFKHSGFTGSYFRKCIFKNCILDFAVFDNCYFNDCTFIFDKETKIPSASFCNSFFINSTLRNCYLHGCSLTGVSFDCTEFISCCLDDIIWENAKIMNCLFESVRLRNLNIEFVYFSKNRFINTKIPFASIPYAFNCIKYLLETEDDIYIDSATNEIGLSKKEYIEIIPDLIYFYSKTNNYFPLANIYASIGNLDESFSTIKKSVPFLVKLHEYRTLKYISQLMKFNNFSLTQKSEIYKLIKLNIYKQKLYQEDRFLNADLYLFEIRNNLLNDTEKAKVTFEMYTNIDNKSPEKLSLFLNDLETIFSEFKEEYHYIEYRHNSPYQFLLNIVSSPEEIVKIICVIYFVYLGIDKFYNHYLDTKQKRLSVKKTELEIKKLENEANQKNKTSIDKLKTISSDMSQKNIKINTIYHNVYNIDLTNLYGNDFQQYTNCK